MSSKNDYYDNPNFVLIKVRFSAQESRRYTYVAHTKHNIEVGDWVTVPVGEVENVFGVATGYRDIQTVEVTAVTDDMRHLPKKFDVKMIVSTLKKSSETYQVFYENKMKYFRGE